MSNLATVTPIRPTLAVVERQVADLDDGFIMIAMRLYEELIGANLTRNQAKVAHAVCRKTYGFKKKMDRIADSQLAEIARISRSKANIAKNELISMKVLISEAGKIGPNKNIDEWVIPECSQIGNFVSKSGTKNVSKPDTQDVPALGAHKRNTLNIKETNLIPDGIKCATGDKKPSVQKQKISCEEVWQCLKDELPEARGWRALSDKRRNLIRKFWLEANKIARQLDDGQPLTIQGFRAYLQYISRSCRWMLEDRPDNRTGRTWRRMKFDSFLSATLYLEVREGDRDDI